MKILNLSQNNINSHTGYRVSVYELWENAYLLVGLFILSFVLSLVRSFSEPIPHLFSLPTSLTPPFQAW